MDYYYKYQKYKNKYIKLKLQQKGGTEFYVTLDDNYLYDPETLVVKVGDIVIWKNNSKETIHDVVADDKSFDSGEIEPNGGIFKYQFNEVGKYPYFSSLHLEHNMKGIVIVEI